MKIITDSSSDLTPELIAHFGVDAVIPMKISIDGRRISRQSGSDKRPILSGAAARQQDAPQDLPNHGGRIHRGVQPLPDEELLVLPLSSGLSGSYGMACVAREETGRSDIYVVDNKATALALALMVQIASERRAQSVSAAEIAAELEALSSRVRVYAPVETLQYLVMGGRLSKAAGFVGHSAEPKARHLPQGRRALLRRQSARQQSRGSSGARAGGHT